MTYATSRKTFAQIESDCTLRKDFSSLISNISCTKQSNFLLHFLRTENCLSRSFGTVKCLSSLCLSVEEDIFLCSPTRWCKTACKRTQHCWPTTPNTVGYCMLCPFAHPVAVVAHSLKAVKLFSQQLPTFLLFRDSRSVAQQCWIRLDSSSNIVGATHAHYAFKFKFKSNQWFTKTYGLYPSHDALQVTTLLRVFFIRLQTTANTYPTTPNIVGAAMLGVVASVCTKPKCLSV